MASFKREKRILRRARIRAKVSGTHLRPRAAVSRSLKHTSIQFIDDEKRTTLFSLSDASFAKEESGKTKSERAHMVGKQAGEELKKRKIESVVFDRGGFKYHGRVKAVAEGLREAGISL